MTYNDKKQLYESIIKDVAKVVKRRLNEADYNDNLTHLICKLNYNGDTIPVRLEESNYVRLIFLCECIEFAFIEKVTQFEGTVFMELKYPDDFYRKVKQYRLGFEDFDDFIRESSTLMVALSAIDKVIRDEDSTVIELADAIESIKISKADDNKI